MFVSTRIKVRVLLVTAVLGLLLIAPVTSPAFASDCSSSTTSSCGG